MSKVLKKYVTTELVKEFQDVDSCVIIGVKGITAEDVREFRRDLESKDIHVKVVKNSMAQLAFKEIGKEPMGSMFDGSCAVIYGADGAVTISREVMDWKKKIKAIDVKGTYFEGAAHGEDIVTKLSKIPSRQVLLGQVAGLLQSPMRGMAGACAGIIRKFMYALQAVKDQKAA